MEETKSEKSPDVEMVLEENQSKPEEMNENEALKETEDSKMETIVEKNAETETDPKSDFLAMVQNDDAPAVVESTQSSKPREILELYETARYYGVVLDESSMF